MTVYAPFVNGTLLMEDQRDIFSSPLTYTLYEITRSVRDGQRYLNSISVDDIIGFLDAAGSMWSERDSVEQQQFAQQGLNFLVYWFRRTHLCEILDVSLHGDRTVLDTFCDIPGVPYKLSAQPRGVICHWLAGNVPMLGMLSLAQGLLTKNANILKVSRHNGHVVPNLINSFAQVSYHNPEGKEILGSEIVRSMAAVYFESDDQQAQEELSHSADVRVAWGGLDAVEAVMNTTRRYGTEDVIFGPKTSFMAIGREMLPSTEYAESLARRAAVDASLFEQRGCNSPHTVFVEKGGVVKPEEFAKLLAGEMAKAAERMPRTEGSVASADTTNILRVRAEYDMRGEAYYPTTLDWTVLYSDDDKGLAEPCYNRTVFVRPVEDIMGVEEHCSHFTQSTGVALSSERKEEFARRVTARGIERVPDVGSMTLFEAPWEGMFVMERFVRWCRL